MTTEAINPVVVVDIGGSSIRTASVRPDGACIDEVSAVDHGATGDEVMKIVADHISQLHGSQAHRGVVLGVPGVVSMATGTVDAPALDWRDYSPVDQLVDHSLPIHVENDVNLAVLGEWQFGAGRGKSDVVMLMIGTGLGAGIVAGGVLVRGGRGGAGEAGFLAPTLDALTQTVSGFGPMESVVSAPGLERLARLRDPDLNASVVDIAAAARNGEEWARQVFEVFADHLAVAILDVAALLDPEMIAIGGGVGGASDLFLERATDQARSVLPGLAPVVVSELGVKAPLMGGSALFRMIDEEAHVNQRKAYS